MHTGQDGRKAAPALCVSRRTPGPLVLRATMRRMRPRALSLVVAAVLSVPWALSTRR